jgi:hypothetical protein
MSSFYDFAGNHPWLTVILACVIFGSLSDAFRRCRR